MDRRQFSTFALTCVAAPFAQAQGTPLAGKHYTVLAQRQRTLESKRVEVLEFFAYSCSHCAAFEPALQAWQKTLPADVLFRRIPVAFREVPFVIHQKLYFAFEALGLVEQLHAKVFHALHSERKRLETPEDISSFVAKNGVDKARFMETLNSFSVATKSRQASGLSTGYKIEGTPSMGVDGRWLTSGSMAGSNERALGVVEYLLSLAKKGE